MRIGIFGGTFDPPHNGHLAVAETCLRELQLDEVIFLPAFRNPLKTAGASAPPKARLEMVRLAIKDQPNMAVSDIEITRGGKSYAVDTLSEFQAAQQADYWFLLGADALKTFSEWKNPQRIIKLCRLAAVTRIAPNETDPLIRAPQELRDAVDIVKMAPIPTSSTEIRDLIARNRSVASLVPPAVAEYIRENKLYKN